MQPYSPRAKLREEHMETNGRPARGYLPTLDGWRALAITLVILQHAADNAGLSTAGLAAAPFRQGVFGVEIFFAISGLLITSRLVHEYQTAHGISLKAFYLRRLFRIYPGALVFLFSLAALRLAGMIYLPVKHWLVSLFGMANFVNYFFHDSWTWYLGHFWSLAVEEHFYLLWPGILALAGLRRGLPVAMLLALTLALWRIAAPTLFHQTMNDDFWTRTDICADGLLWGCACALVIGTQAGAAWMRRLAQPLVWWVVFLAAAAYAAAGMGGAQRLIGQGGLAIALAFLVAGTVVRPDSRFARLLEWPALRWLGRLSYSLYLWQQLFLAAGVFKSAKLAAVQRFPLNLLMAFALAILSYYGVERPLIRLGHRLTRKNLPAATPESPAPHPASPSPEPALAPALEKA